MRRLVALAAAALAVSAIPLRVAHAATYTVNSLADTDDGSCDSPPAGDCTLREAINAANGNPGQDAITFDGSLSGTIHLSSQLPQIVEPVTIDGRTAGGPIVLDGGGSVPSGLVVTVWWGRTEIRNLTLSNFAYAGIEVTLARDAVLVANVTVTDSHYGVSAEMWAWGAPNFGNLTVADSEIRSADVGILSAANNVTVVRSVVEGCAIAGILQRNGGGGLPVDDGVEVRSSRVADNRGAGVLVRGANISGVRIGAPGEGNNISGNGLDGVVLDENGSGVLNESSVTWNEIKHNGLLWASAGVVLRGRVEGIEVYGNNVSLNGIDGAGNLVTPSVGIALITNSTSGRGPSGNFIGRDSGDTIHAGNEVVGNGAEGILLSGADTSNNEIAYCLVGVSSAGNPGGNLLGGVTISGGGELEHRPTEHDRLQFLSGRRAVRGRHGRELGGGQCNLLRRGLGCQPGDHNHPRRRGQRGEPQRGGEPQVRRGGGERDRHRREQHNLQLGGGVRLRREPDG